MAARSSRLSLNFRAISCLHFPFSRSRAHASQAQGTLLSAYAHMRRTHALREDVIPHAVGPLAQVSFGRSSTASHLPPPRMRARQTWPAHGRYTRVKAVHSGPVHRSNVHTELLGAAPHSCHRTDTRGAKLRAPAH